MDKFNRITVLELFNKLEKEIQKGYGDNFVFVEEFYITNEELSSDGDGEDEFPTTYCPVIHIQDVLLTEDEDESISDKLRQLRNYIMYLLSNVEMFKIDKEITEELFSLLKDATDETFDEVVKRLDEISVIINNSINNMYDSISPQVETMRKYLQYLNQQTNLIFEEAYDKVSDNTMNYIKEQSEKFADSLEQFSKFIRKGI
jgi:hypothetical protein